MRYGSQPHGDGSFPKTPYPSWAAGHGSAGQNADRVRRLYEIPQVPDKWS